MDVQIDYIEFSYGIIYDSDTPRLKLFIHSLGCKVYLLTG
jgi:hypothetical protein